MAILNDIAAALTGSVASAGETPITGQLKGLVGVNPAYSFNGDLNTGFGSDVADELYAQAGGVKTVRVTAAGIVITGTMSMTGAFQGTLTSTGATVGFVGYEAISTEAGGGTGPIISAYRNSASPGSNDQIGAYDYAGNTSTSVKITYARTYTIATDVTNGSEDAEWRVQIRVAGAFVDRIAATAGGATVTGEVAATSFKSGANPTSQPGKVPTTQEFTSGSGNYTPTVGAVWIKVRAVAGGGGGGGTAGAAGAGTNTLFNGIQANPGAGGANFSGASGGAGGAGGSGGGGFANLRCPGGAGGDGGFSSNSSSGNGGEGGQSPFGGAAPSTSTIGTGRNAVANSGSGGSGIGNAGAGAGGGGAGEYMELILPAAVYAYTVGAGGSPATNGGAGAAGRIFVEEYYS